MKYDYEELYQAEFKEVLQRYEFDGSAYGEACWRIVELELQVERLSQMLSDRHTDEETIEEALADCLR